MDEDHRVIIEAHSKLADEISEPTKMEQFAVKGEDLKKKYRSMIKNI
jgi:hypothetical protein